MIRNINLKEINWGVTARNIFFLLRKEMKELLFEQRQISTYNSILLTSILSEDYRKKYANEINNLLKQGCFKNYPSHNTKSFEVQAFYDKKYKMPYVLHAGKKLFFPRGYSVQQAMQSYSGYINGDLILEKHENGSPHQYQSADFCVKDGDVLIDVGCAEALFALDAVEKASKIYLVERDPKWIKALKATFEPYSNKVVFVRKLITDRNSKNTITLDTLLKNEVHSSLFIKMDIEGYEVPVIKSSQDFLKQNIDICLACCTYHKNNDAIELEKQFKELEYTTEFSNGYMLFIRYDQPVYPYFRHGVIRAKKQKNNKE